MIASRAIGRALVTSRRRRSASGLIGLKPIESYALRRANME